MAARATVELVVDESGATQGFTRFQARAMSAFKGAKGEAAGLQEQIARLSASIDGLAASGVKGTAAVSAGLKSANEHGLTTIDTVRQLRDELGIRVPRSMEKLIAGFSAFQQVASVAFGAVAFVGMLQLAGAVGDKFAEWGHIISGDTKAVQDLRAAIVEANNAIIVNPVNTDVGEKSLETLKKTAARYKAQADTSFLEKSANFMLRWTDPNAYTPDDRDRLQFGGQAEQIATENQALALSASITKQKNEILKENTTQTRANIEIQLEGLRKIAQATANAHALVQDKTLGINGQEKTLTPAQAHTENTLIDQKAAADYAVLSRKYADEVRDAWQASAVARVQGEQRAYTQISNTVKNFEEQARRDGRMDSPDGQAQVYGEETAMWSKYLAEKAERQKEFTDETLRMAQQARILEAEGSQRAFAEESVALERLAKERIDSGRQSLEFEQEFADRRVQIERDTDAKITASIKEYADKQREAHAESVVNDSKGYARIAAEQSRRTADSNKQFGDITSGLQWDDPRYITAKTAHDGQLADIGKTSDDRRQDLHQRNVDETQGIRDEASSTHSSGGGLMGMLAEEQAQTAKINAEYDKRRQHLKEALDGGVVNEQEAADQATAIEDLHTAQLDAQYRSMREKIAGSIESGFKDPLGAIKSAMQRQMAEIIADWIMQLGVFKTMFGGTMTSRAPGPSQSSGGILGAIMQHQQPAATSTGSAVDAGTYSPAISASSTTASGGFSGASTTLSQAVAAPIGGVAGTTMSPSSVISGTLGMSRTGVDAVQALQQPSPTTAASDDDAAWNDPSKMSSSDPSSAGYHVGATSTGVTALGVAGAAMGAYTGTTGIIGAFESGKASGILSGAESGAAMGASIGMLAGPMGAAIGAGAGAVGGATAGLVGWASGEGGRIQGQKYYRDTLRPQMEEIEKTYLAGSGGDATSTISQLNQAAVSGYDSLVKSAGASAAAWTRDTYITKELQTLTSDIERMAGGGRDYTARSMAEFHDGGRITGFGDYGTSSNEGLIHAMLDETVMNRAASTTHPAALGLMNAGATQAQMAGHYLSMMQPQAPTIGAPSGGDTHHHWDVKTLDAKSFQQNLRGGWIGAIDKELNHYATTYSGEGQ